VRNEQDGTAFPLELSDAIEAFILKGDIPDGEDFVDEQDLGLNMHGDSKCQAHLHARAVGAKWAVDKGR
jgi:hypothetical protein